jgi:small subunit ribosomal protein S13
MVEQNKTHIPGRKEEKSEVLVRIMQTDIPGSKNIYSGLTRIKGVSFSMVNAICKISKMERKRKIETLSQQEIDKLTDLIKNPPVPTYLKNRRSDFESGEDKHLSISDLDLQKEFDIKRLKKIKSYKGVRHSRNLPVRGQRTKSHFRRGGKNRVVGVKKKK